VRTEVSGRRRRQTCAVEWLMWGLEGRQVDVQGLDGSAVTIIAGGTFACAIMVKGASTVEGQDWARDPGWVVVLLRRPIGLRENLSTAGS